MSFFPFTLLGRKSDKELREASAAHQNKAWKDQCQKLEMEKLAAEHRIIKQESELKDLRSKVEYMHDSLGKVHMLRESMASTETVEFGDLREALGDSRKSDPILQSVFYLLNRRLNEMERATEEDISNSLKMAFENGRCSAMRAVKEDLLGLIAEAGAEQRSKHLGETRSPFPLRKEGVDYAISLNQAQN